MDRRGFVRGLVFGVASVPFLSNFAFAKMTPDETWEYILERYSDAHKHSMFEFNDELTRKQFSEILTNYMEKIPGKHNVEDYKIVCDETNNTPEVIDRNEFHAHLYVKLYEREWRSLKGLALRTGVSYNDIMGKF